MTDTTVRFIHDGAEFTGRLIAKKGMFWQVETEPGIVKNVPIRSIIQDTPPEVQADPAPAAGNRIGPANPNTMAAQLAAAQRQAQEEKEKPAKKEKAKKGADPDLVSLADLCKEAKILGRIARRRLRKVYGTLQDGARWEWKKDDAELEKIRALLAAKEDPAPEADQEEDDEGQTDEARAGLAEEALAEESEED